jgi:Protein of Unknown function (DUF2784)
MLARLAADAVVLFHLGFILFVVLGGLLALRWRKVVWVHVPAAVWGAFIEFSGWICPLTPLENWLRAAAGSPGFSGGFIDHYVMPVVYPAGLTRGLQVVLGAAVVAVNAGVYGVLLVRRLRQTPEDA